MMKSRRSIRHYKDEDIPSETLRKLTDALAYSTLKGVLSAFPEMYRTLEIPEGYTMNFVLLAGIPAVSYRRSVQKEAASVKIL